MHLYTVTDISTSSRLVALRDQRGRYHAAHCTSRLPDVGEELRGSLPERGFTLLIRSDGGVSRMTFSQVNCAQSWIFGLLHPNEGRQREAAVKATPVAVPEMASPHVVNSGGYLPVDAYRPAGHPR